MKKNFKLIFILTFIFANLFYTISVEAKTLNVKRIFGANRYNTSVKIAEYSYETLNGSVIIANGENFADALSGSSLSKQIHAPILLVPKNIQDSQDTIDYINRSLNKDGTIYILGGTGSIGDDYISKFNSLGYANIVRIGGTNRFDTNSLIVKKLSINKGTPIVLVNGYDYPDALSVSSVSSSLGYPMFMTNSNNIPNEIKQNITDIQPSKVYLIGGQTIVNDSIIQNIKDIIPSVSDSNIIRVSGNDRYEMSLNIAKQFNLNTDTVFMANGEGLVDALGGSALAASLNSPILLTDGSNIQNQKQYIDSNSNYSKVILLGGTGVINSSVENVLNGTIDFIDYKADGFNIKIPNDWKLAHSESNNSTSKTYYLFNDDLFDITLKAETFQMNEKGYDETARIEAYLLDKPQLVYIEGADIAYQYVDYNDDITTSSRNVLVAFKGNICYILDASQKGVFEGLGKVYKSDYIKRKNDIFSKFEKIASTFKLTNESVDFTKTVSPQEFYDNTRSINRNTNEPLDEYGKEISIGDCVNCGGFYGLVEAINGSKILVYWNAKSDAIPDKDLSYWETMFGVKYNSEQWIESIELKIDSN